MASNTQIIPLKFIVVGACQVGKSCLVRAFSELPFDSEYSATVGVTFSVKQVIWDDLTLRIQLWDTAGQEVYRSITQTYYHDADCAFVVYDITDRESFLAVESWIEDVKRIGPPICLVVLVGNKVDRVGRRDVSTAQVDELVAKHAIMAFETSAKTGENVEVVFKQSIQAVLERRQKDGAAAGKGNGQGLDAAEGGGCCK
jgi:small GTP-binding protein